MINLGAQYYRPPFPEQKYWEDDLKKMKDSGLNAVQLWFIWGWMEPAPGEFIFDDYDRLVELANKVGLRIIGSTIAEIHPCWIHRYVPGSEMITNMGHKVISSARSECHFGITPGGCFDHPDVWRLMKNFLSQVVMRYRSSADMAGWDAWNELRWDVNADGLVCYCEHTVKAFRFWLDKKYGGLDGLNSAWKRRYRQLDEVMPPKACNRPYTEIMAFQHFMNWRACMHGKARYEVLKALDPNHPITCHGGCPTPLEPAEELKFSLNRGNDWLLADHMDGIGCSSFPIWSNIDDVEFAARLDFVRSAAGQKDIWLSELQGGQAAFGFDYQEPVKAFDQQRWLWNGIANKAQTIIFWCWRNEVFGRESGGFGLTGDDGFADERLEALKLTAKVIEDNSELLENYKPKDSKVGVFFSPHTYFLEWAQQANHQPVQKSLMGYARALVRLYVPYILVEEGHLEALDGLKVLFMPRTLVINEKIERRLETFIKEGGTLVCESECGAFTPEGFYRYPRERFTSRLAGTCEIGRRKLTGDHIAVSINGQTINLGAKQWLTPWQPMVGNILAKSDQGSLITEVRIGKGKLVLCASYLGQAYYEKPSQGFESFIKHITDQANCQPEFEIIAPRCGQDSFLNVRTGTSMGKKVVFIFFQAGHNKAHIRFKPGFFSSAAVRDIITQKKFDLEQTPSGQELKMKKPPMGLAMLIDAE